jgi:hypothetical protein
VALLLGSAVLVALAPVTGASAAAAGPPANDEIAHARVISSIPSRYSEDTSKATYNPATDTGGYPCMGGNSVWFRYRPDHDLTARFTTQGSDFDTLLGVYRGPASRLTPIECNDETTVRSAVQVRLSAGATYFIAVSRCCEPTFQSGGLAVLNVYLPRALRMPVRILGQSAGDVSGRAFFHGTVSCSNPGYYSVLITLSQRVGALVASGSNYVSGACDRTKQSWNIAVDSGTGVAFRAAPASITVDKSLDDGFGYLQQVTNAILTLALTPNKGPS